MMRGNPVLVHSRESKSSEFSVQHRAANAQDPDDVIRAWLEYVIRETGLKPTPLAKKAGLSPSTLLRALDKEHPVSMERRTIEAIVSKLGVKPPAIYGDIGQPPMVAVEVVEAPEHSGFCDTEAQSAWLVRGRQLELAGVLPGDIIVADGGIPLQTGDVVVAREAGARVVLRLYDPPYLTTHTADPTGRRKPQLLDNETVQIVGAMIKLIRQRQKS